MTSDEHIEAALDEYNARIDACSDMKDMPELLIRRGTILQMMSSYISALSDFEEAADIMEEMLSLDMDVDTGLYAKAYMNIGILNPPEMDVAYARIARILDEIGGPYLDANGITEMCMSCAYDLIDSGMGEDAMPFLEKALGMLSGDVESRNAESRICGLIGSIWQSDDRMKAMDSLTMSIDIARTLFDEDNLEDPMELVLSLVTLGDISDAQDAIEFHKEAADIMESLHANGSLEDTETLAALCKGIASELFDTGDEAAAELYLMKSAKYQALR